MMLEENTNKVVIAADIRNQTKCYRQGAMGNYSTAFSVSVKKNEKNIIPLAKRVASQVINICMHPQKEMLVLACYIHMQPELIDAVAISTLGNFESKAGKIQIIENGVAVDYSEEEATKILSEKEVTAIADVKMGEATATAWGCDLTYDYVKINADYRS